MNTRHIAKTFAVLGSLVTLTVLVVTFVPTSFAPIAAIIGLPATLIVLAAGGEARESHFEGRDVVRPNAF